MPRQSRIDAPGALHHIIVRGIERRKIFMDDQDRDRFVERLGTVVTHTETICYAWALIPNHIHLLLGTGMTPIATVMRRLLTGHAVCFNLRHNRQGHLFQNRYKSILCQKDTYLLELVRYIHLNPLRAKLVEDLDGLENFPYCGHGTIIGKCTREWQETETVLSYFDDRLGPARRGYKVYVAKGIDQGRRWDLTGGGLIRSAGGWGAVKAQRKEKTHIKSDERILGDERFVERILAESQEHYERQFALKAKGVDIDTIADRVAELLGIQVNQVWQSGKSRLQVKARSLLCFWAVRELGVTMTAMSRRLGISVPAVSKSVVRGGEIVGRNGYTLNLS